MKKTASSMRAAAPAFVRARPCSISAAVRSARSRRWQAWSDAKAQ
jgi:hypothetical protein